MKNRRGFTLFEMLVVICILGLLALFIAPNISAIYQQRQLQNSAVLLHNDLRWAQARAASQQENIQIKFQKHGYQIINLDAGEEMRTVTLAKKIQIKHSSSIFFAGSYAPTGNGHIVIGNERRDYYVYYYKTGRIRLSREANS